MLHETIFLATYNATPLQVKLLRVTTSICCNLTRNEKIALQVAEKVEASSNFRNMNSCTVKRATCLAILGFPFSGLPPS